MADRLAEPMALPEAKRASAAATLLPLALAGTLACAPEPDEGSDGGPGEDFEFALGQGEVGFRPLENGDTLELVLGGQGLLMFPMPVRGAGFELPPDPRDYTHPKIPLLDATIDVEGHNNGIGGHFIYLANYRIPFTILEDGSYQFNYVALIIPDHVEDVAPLDGLPATVRAELAPHGLAEPLVFEREVVLDTQGFSEVPGAGEGG